MKKLILYLSPFFLISIAILAFMYKYIEDWGQTPVVLKQPITIEYPAGTSLKKLSSILKTNHVVNNGLFQVYVRLHASYPNFQAGKYKFEGSITPAEVAEMISTGKTFAEVVAEITIPEGFTIGQVRDRLVANGIGNKTEISKLFKDQKFITSLGITSKSLEGYLYPATYRFHKIPSSKEALKTMTDEFLSVCLKAIYKKSKRKNLALIRLLPLLLL